jgi:hypothetical protein
VYVCVMCDMCCDMLCVNHIVTCSYSVEALVPPCLSARAESHMSMMEHLLKQHKHMVAAPPQRESLSQRGTLRRRGQSSRETETETETDRKAGLGLGPGSRGGWLGHFPHHTVSCLDYSQPSDCAFDIRRLFPFRSGHLSSYSHTVTATT